MTDVEGASGRVTSAPARPPAGRRRRWRPALAVLGVCSLGLLPLALVGGPGGAATLGSLQAQADSLQQQIASVGAQISALGQKYDQAEGELNSIDSQISVTKQRITGDQQTVSMDKLHLRSAAIDEYETDGSAVTNPLFADNQRSFADAQEYGQVATGNLGTDLADLHTAEVALDAQKADLTTQQGAAQSAVEAAQQAEAEANQQQSVLDNDLSQVKGQIGTLEEQAQASADAAEATQTQSVLADGADFPPPPPNGAAGAAVAAAETQLGVPYVWGGTSPSTGFDCSGLVMWAWAQAGVDLPHYSGSQFDDTTPVPVSDMEPGDILFYGPGGDQHEAMYVGGGEMIEAPETGQVVHITPIRLGDGFSGVHRV